MMTRISQQICFYISRLLSFSFLLYFRFSLNAGTRLALGQIPRQTAKDSTTNTGLELGHHLAGSMKYSSGVVSLAHLQFFASASSFRKYPIAGEALAPVQQILFREGKMVGGSGSVMLYDFAPLRPLRKKKNK